MSRNYFVINIVIVLVLFRNIGHPRMAELCLLSMQEQDTEQR